MSIPDDFIPYDRWSTRQRGATPATHPIGATEGVTLHWEGPHMGTPAHGDCAGKVRGIQAFHRDVRHWADIAYNALVCPHGAVFEGRGLRTASAANGDEVQNDRFYAVCYLGGEGDPFTDAAKGGFHDAVQWLRTEGGAGPAVNGHRDVRPEPTACPGDVIHHWLDTHNFNITQEEFEMDEKAEKAFGKVFEKLAALAAAQEATHKRLNELFAGERKRDRAAKKAAAPDA